jgi:hypothetical protein
MPLEVNRHHIAHYDSYWCANQHNMMIRQSLGMIALMAVDPHNALHRDCPAPPPLDPYTAQRVSGLYVPHPNPLVGIDNFRFAVEKAIRHRKTKDIEKQIGLLTIEAVTLQLPYIRDGLVGDY